MAKEEVTTVNGVKYDVVATRSGQQHVKQAKCKGCGGFIRGRGKNPSEAKAEFRRIAAAQHSSCRR